MPQGVSIDPGWPGGRQSAFLEHILHELFLVEQSREVIVGVHRQSDATAAGLPIGFCTPNLAWHSAHDALTPGGM